MGDQLLPFPWLDVVLILALVALNGVFAMSELAIVSSREARLKAMAKAGNGGARRALDLAAEPGRFLSTVQIGITLIGILAGAYSGASLGQPVAQIECGQQLMIGVQHARRHADAAVCRANRLGGVGYQVHHDLPDADARRGQRLQLGVSAGGLPGNAAGQRERAVGARGDPVHQVVDRRLDRRSAALEPL